MGIDPNQICKQAWHRIVLGSDVDPRLYSKFDDRCLDNMVNAENFTPSKQCVFERSGDKFVLDKKGQKKELAEPKIINCLVYLAAVEKWLENQLAAVKLPDPPKAAGLADDATPTAAKNGDAKPADVPKAVGLPAEATPTADAPKAVGLPSDVTPAADAPKAAELPTDVTPTVAKPVATSNDTAPSLLILKNRLSVIAGVFFNITPTGLSVNDGEPKIPYTSGGFVWGRAGGLITPAALSAHLAYTTFVGIQGEGMPFSAKERSTPYSNDFNVWGVGPAVSGLFVYDTGQNGFRIVGGPDLAFLVGSLSSKGPIDVGIPDRLYVAQKPRIVGTALAGLSVGFETSADKGGPSWMVLLGTGLRWFFHGDQVTDTPPGYEGTMVRLNRGPLFDHLKFSMGFNY